MKRRAFLAGTAGLTGLIVPVVGRAVTRPCRPGSVGGAGGPSVTTSCSPADAEADWLARSTGPGVVWAHDFRHPDEVDFFRNESGLGNVPSLSNSDGNCRRITTDGLTGGACLELNVPGNIVANVASATASNPIRITTSTPHGLTAGSTVRLVGMTGGFSVLNDKSGGGGGTIHSHKASTVVSATTFEIAHDGSLFAKYAGGGKSSTAWVAKSAWKRPFSAVAAGLNGLPTPDIGGARGEHPLRAWTGSTEANAEWRWRRDYYGHADYHRQFPTWAQVGGSVEGDIWRGTDFWIQFRTKISASRWHPGNPSGKLVFIDTTAVQPLHQIIIRSANTTKRNGSPPFPTSYFSAYTGGSYARSLVKIRDGVGELQQPGGEFDHADDPSRTCYRDSKIGKITNYCWRWPIDEWVTVLVHVIPGHHFPNWGGRGLFPNGGDTGLQVWVANQSRLDRGYVRILDASGFPFNFDTGGVHPPGWNEVKLSAYMNNVPAPVGWTHRFDQIIFSKKTIPCPLA